MINERIEALPENALSPAIAGALPKGEPQDACNLRGMGAARCICKTNAKLAIKTEERVLRKQNSVRLSLFLLFSLEL